MTAEEVRTPPAEMVQGKVALPAGARIVSQSLSGDRIAIETELPNGGRAFFLFDTSADRMVGRYDVTAE